MDNINTSRFTHDFAIEAVLDLHPHLAHGSDFLIGHTIDRDTGEQLSEPFFLRWSASVPQPSMEFVRQHFKANEARIRASYVRKWRDQALDVTDGKMVVPSDRPDRAAIAEQWGAYRQALRDLTEHPGFPFTVEWPQAPEPV